MLTDMPNIDPLTRRVFSALHRTIHGHQHRMARELAKKGAQPVEAFGLHLLSEHDGVAQRDLADRLHVSRPWVTKMVQSLEKSGAVVRRPDEFGRRLTRVFLTDRGRERELELRSVFCDYLDRTVGVLPDEEKVELERLLNKLNDGLCAEVENSPGGMAGCCSLECGGSRERPL